MDFFGTYHSKTQLPVKPIDVHQLASCVRSRVDNVLVIDSRSFLEYNTCHVQHAIR